MKVDELVKSSIAKLEEAGIRTARLDVLVLLEQVSGKDRSWLLAHQGDAIDKQASKLLAQLVKKRAQRTPLAQLTGKQEFWGLEFKVTPNVLIPRPESEKIIEFALDFDEDFASVLDVGTGCGCLAITLAKERPHWAVSGSELSSAALQVATDNAKKHEVSVNFYQSDLLENAVGKFNIITANLPYVRDGHRPSLTPEATKEPELALFGGPDGLDLYRKFFKQVPKHAKPNGLVIVEADPWQHSELIRIAEDAGCVLKSQDRFVVAFSFVGLGRG